MITIVNIGLNRFKTAKSRNGRRIVIHRNVREYFEDVRWFSKKCRVLIQSRIKHQYPGWALTGYALHKEIRV